ncbi:protein of unknown function (DUF4835) [Candidatus Kryptobacter tengchongensis]|uniref:type IX secretion system protein PorD n=1 Tax=Kryptobacter tengchongensis TaxID=1643429 RepID=UPI00070763A6|nr:DUF4835 family protein [Candidatus Kryptobacter tengchongensis]CUS86149.1 protein of unknown function (DUF4835) [Candidatus Kryptobacter tengchongensis]CUU04448.1 protein of unknown function (DUF4835) [Candidatus Kryptobacter tengchongensis]CUU10525.1 protein of unknown function (DUF4835) [Candidatus Kryptobacter tengchongensis]
MTRKFLLTVTFITLFISSSLAQEIECKVTVNFEQLPPQNKSDLSDFAEKIQRYINTYKWTDVDLGGEKIQCTLNIFFTSASGNNYQAQIFIGSQRKIYDSDKSTALLRILDDKVDFYYDKNAPMYHDEFRFDPLLSLIDFYMYIVIGYDFDTYEPLGGTEFFEKAFRICTNAQSSRYSRGWQKVTSGFSRFNLIDELLDSKYSNFRKAMYDYHYNGLDLLQKKTDEALATIDSVIDVIIKIKKDVNPTSTLVKLFFDAKYMELAEIFKLSKNKEAIYKKLILADPSHQSTYLEYMKD